MQTAINLVREGGMTMVPLFACSLLALAIVLERLYSLRRSRIIPAEIVEKLRGIQSDSDCEKLASFCDAKGGPLARVIVGVLANRHLPRAENLELMRVEGRQKLAPLEHGLTGLAIIAGISPLLGLLGTVIGMVNVFDVIAAQGIGDAAALSAGISKALVTTIAGLSIAIPSLVAHGYFSKRVDDLVGEIESHAVEAIISIYDGSAKGSKLDERIVAG